MNLETEAEQLKSAWARYAPEFLDGYLVHGVENPCFNPQSVVMRGLVIKAILAGRESAAAGESLAFPPLTPTLSPLRGEGVCHGSNSSGQEHLPIDTLLRQERLYSACACMTLLAGAQGRFDAFTAALEGERNADRAYPLPEFLKELRGKTGELPFTLRSVWQPMFQAMLGGFSNFGSPFEVIWRERLHDAKASPIKLLETACGSANDYRYFERYGLDHLVDYTGVDICPANIANARRRCPKGMFLEADAMRLPFPDKSFDYYMVFDLFEHLSLEAFDCALREAVRVTRRGLSLSFFQLDWQKDHQVVPEPPYHRNVLSIPRTLEALDKLGCEARLMDIPAEWAREFPGYSHYNPRARMIEARVKTKAGD